MKLTTGILALTTMTATMTLAPAWAQNPGVIQNTRNQLNAVQQTKIAQSNQALAATQGQGQGQGQGPEQGHASPARPISIKPAPGVGARRAAPVVTAKPAVTHHHPVTVAKMPEAAPAPHPAVAVAEQNVPTESKNDGKKTYSLTGKRDPFLSPVVNRSMVGSGCNTGKKCLAVDQINLRGIVKFDSGMIAVVVNALDKAYFLHENDPVFNGYVMKITGDSITFKETVQDQMGKPLTREVTKKIATPAV